MNDMLNNLLETQAKARELREEAMLLEREAVDQMEKVIHGLPEREVSTLAIYGLAKILGVRLDRRCLYGPKGRPDWL